MSPNKILCLSGVQVGYTIRNVKTAEVRSNKEKQENSRLIPIWKQAKMAGNERK